MPEGEVSQLVPDAPDTAQDSLKRAIASRNEVIASISLVVMVSKNKLILTRSKVIYEKRTAWGGISANSIDIGDLAQVTVSAGPILGLLHFAHGPHEFPDTAGMFWRKDAIRMKRAIQGYVVALKQGIDTSAIPVEKLVPMLIELGTDDPSIRR